nr:hypothetical protein [uncultured Flavobacterium sp.]
MKKLSFIVFAVSLIFFSCSNDNSTMEEESARLSKMYAELVTDSQINSKTCTNPDEWAILRFNESLCSGYIIYNKSIDTVVFRKKVNKYIEAHGKFDAKWGILYDCVTLPSTAEISCVEGKATLTHKYQ